jgi:hypothetical protein
MRAYTALAILLIVAGVLSVVTAYVKTVDPATIPGELQPAYEVILYVFATSAAAPLFTIIANLYGYLKVYYKTKPEERAQLHYEFDKLAATWLTYERDIKGIGVFITVATTGTPYEKYAVWAAGGLAFILETILSVFTKLSEATQDQAEALKAASS